MPAGEDGPQCGVPACGVRHSDQCGRGLVWADSRAGWYWEGAAWHPTGHQAACGAQEKVTSPGAAEEVGERRKDATEKVVQREEGRVAVPATP